MIVDANPPVYVTRREANWVGRAPRSFPHPPMRSTPTGSAPRMAEALRDFASTSVNSPAGETEAFTRSIATDKTTFIA
jgi:hypothetical protein